MTIHEPCIITPRLLPGVRIGNAFISIEYAGGDFEGRTVYRTYLDTPDFEHEDTEVRSGVGGGSLQEGLRSVLSFMGACAESVAYGRRHGEPGENADLYPPDVAEWCDANSDELSMLSCELEETSDLIEE